MTPRPSTTRLLLAVLAIALQWAAFPSSDRPQRAPRTVHRTRQNCDQGFSARVQAVELAAAVAAVPPPTGGGSAQDDDAPPGILPAPAFTVAADTPAGLLTPATSSHPRTRSIATRFGRAPPVLA